MIIFNFLIKRLIALKIPLFTYHKSDFQSQQSIFSKYNLHYNKTINH